MSVAENLKAIRKKRGMSQVALEIKSGVSQAAISFIEKGKRTPNIETLELLANALRVPVSDLLADEKKPAALPGGLDKELIDLLVDLPDRDVERVKDFVAGLIASRKE